MLACDGGVPRSGPSLAMLTAVALTAAFLPGRVMAQDTDAPPSADAPPVEVAPDEAAPDEAAPVEGDTEDAVAGEAADDAPEAPAEPEATAPAPGEAATPEESSPIVGRPAQPFPAAPATPDPGTPAPTRPPGTEGPDMGDPSESGLLGDEQALFEEETGGNERRSRVDPYEEPKQNYLFLGGFYRANWTPQGLLKIFADEAPRAIYNPAVGIELVVRKNGFEVIPSLWLQGFRTTGPYRERGDELTETEIIVSDLNTFMGGVGFLWSVEFNKYLSFQYGFDIGVGVTYGDLNRTEAYPTDIAPDAPESERSWRNWSPCPGPVSEADPRRAYCGDVDETEGREVIRDPVTGDAISNADGSQGEHYGINVRRWSDGGGLPNVWFRLALPHLALRYKPIAQLTLRVDAGFDLFSGPYVGFAGHIGF
ncbi:MAG: hypothetical protein AAF447_02915 [Myxococcota bacterium]